MELVYHRSGERQHPDTSNPTAPTFDHPQPDTKYPTTDLMATPTGETGRLTATAKNQILKSNSINKKDDWNPAYWK